MDFFYNEYILRGVPRTHYSYRLDYKAGCGIKAQRLQGSLMEQSGRWVIIVSRAVPYGMT